MSSYNLSNEKHNLVVEFQAYVDNYIPTGYIVDGFETIQRKAIQIVSEYRESIRLNCDETMAYKIAKMAIDELIPYAKGIR